jgi:hypothetical protein
MLRRAVPAALAALVFAVAGCGGDGGGSEAPEDPVAQVPSGLQEKVREARDPQPGDFPAAKGKTLQALADEIGGGSQMGLASSIFVAGRENRVAFGVIDQNAGFLYGKTALYIARTPGAPAKGPYMARADLVGGKPVAAPSQIKVITSAQDKIPEVGERAPKVQTDTVASAGGNVEAIDTRRPTSDMHADFSKVVGKKPVALLFATPQLCQSRVCGPVVDVALQQRAQFGDRVQFIHQEVYADNDPNKGLREPLQQFNLPTEPWLFVVGEDGRITARLEGSFGLDAFERALKTAL